MRKWFTVKRSRLGMLAPALVICLPLWSDVPRAASKSERVCYCDCDAKAGAAACEHLCELAKYEHRAWAVSCHKGREPDFSDLRGNPRSDSSKDNGLQQARR